MLERSFSVRVFSAVSWLVLSSTTSSRWLAYFSSFSTMLSRIFAWLQQEKNIMKRSAWMVIWIVLARRSASCLTPHPLPVRNIAFQFISDIMHRVQTCQGRCPSAAFWLTQTEAGGRGFHSSRPSAGGWRSPHTALRSAAGAAVPLGKAFATAWWSLERSRKCQHLGWNIWPLEGLLRNLIGWLNIFSEKNGCVSWLYTNLLVPGWCLGTGQTWSCT